MYRDFQVMLQDVINVCFVIVYEKTYIKIVAYCVLQTHLDAFISIIISVILCNYSCLVTCRHFLFVDVSVRDMACFSTENI